MYDFEFDTQKSTLNFEKHGIDFVDAQDLWADPNLIEIPANTSDEPRFLVIGIIDNKQLVCRYYLSEKEYPYNIGSKIKKERGRFL